jgi:hypothetical protein
MIPHEIKLSDLALNCVFYFATADGKESDVIGCIWIITKTVLTAVHTLYECDLDLYLDELYTLFAVEHSFVISKPTLFHNHAQAGCT